MKITVGMIRFLDKRTGKDLIVAAYELRIAYGLTPTQASEVVQQWMDIPIV